MADAGGPLRFALAGEDLGHEDAVRFVVDRVLREASWIAAGDVELDHVRRWSEREDIKDAVRRAKERRLPVHGHFGGEPGLPEARMMRAQLLLWEDSGVVDVGFVARDVDRREKQRAACEQAREDVSPSHRVVFALAEPEIEAWRIVCFEPGDDRSRSALAELVKTLDFDPRREPLRLTSTNDGSARDCKRIIGQLGLQGTWAFVEHLVRDPDEWLERGASNGLGAFVADVRREVLPLLDPRARPASS